MWTRQIPLFSLLFVLIVANIGCEDIGRYLPSSWHKKCGWKAENYFDDPQVVALCHAIEANDIPEIDRLVAAGANVNSQGKGKMTPLLWALPDNKLPRFRRLLEHGADPNVIIESDFNTRGFMYPGVAVTHLTCKTSFPGHFEAVFEHGGNPNLVTRTALFSGETPLFILISGSASNKLEKVQVLIDKGADVNQMHTGITPTMHAVTCGYYNISLALLKAGADYRVYQENSLRKLIHYVHIQAQALSHASPQQKSDYDKLVQWLDSHGESLEQARADRTRWDSWSRSTGEYDRKSDAEIAARKAREAREKEVAEQEKAGVQHEPSAGNP